jgi:two-component system, cell cycle sensor histidine kinase and response regulator CckA
MNDSQSLPSILVIEDDPAHREAITRSLELLASRYRVRTAGSMLEATRAMSLERPALVLADLRLRDGNALEMLPDARFPLLVLTSQGDERTAVQSIRAGALDYVVKSPDTLAELPRTVERVLREWRTSQERLHAEQALRESEERFRVLFDAAPDALLIYAPDGRVVDANRAAEQLFGRPRHALVGQPLQALGFEVLPPIAPEPQTLMVRAREVELRTVSLQLSGKPALLATLQDVSARVQAEHAKRRLEEQLHHALKLEALGRLAGGVAHDFNNLLTAISGYAELMLHGGASVAEYPSALHEILSASRRAAGLTSQLLAFSRKQVIEPVILNLNALLESATRMIQRLIGEDIALSFEPGAGLHAVRVDRNQIEQVLINLAVNARDAMPHGGSLRVRTENVRVRDGELEDVLDAVPGEFVLLEVEDNGSGMDEATQDRLFEPFFTTKERGRGTGLGLSILYGVVRQNGGFVAVRSRVGEGACFSIYLPRAEEGEPTPLPLHDQPSARLRGDESILLVEDEPAVRDVVARFLLNAGYHVIAKGDAHAAISLFEHNRLQHIDMLLTDVVLPGLNGKQLYQKLCALRPGLRVLFMSGYTDDVIAKHGLVDASVALLEKPLTQVSLLQAVRGVLDGTRVR